VRFLLRHLYVQCSDLVYSADANNGYIAPATLAQCLQTAKAKGWSAGAMTWQFPNAQSAWATTVRSLSWPVGGTPPPPTTTATPTKTTSTPTSTPTGGTGGCAGLSAWTSAVAYVGGQSVTYGGHKWTAKWWTQVRISFSLLMLLADNRTQADTPGGAAGVWTDNGSC
jgi:chitinase